MYPGAPLSSACVTNLLGATTHVVLLVGLPGPGDKAKPRTEGPLGSQRCEEGYCFGAREESAPLLPAPPPLFGPEARLGSTLQGSSAALGETCGCCFLIAAQEGAHRAVRGGGAVGLTVPGRNVKLEKGEYSSSGNRYSYREAEPAR